MAGSVPPAGGGVSKRNDAPRELPQLLEVRCVNKVAHEDPCARIQCIGGVRDGVTWKLTQTEAMQAIDRGDARFYAQFGNHSVAIVIDENESGRRYLKCFTDGRDPEGLLSLPECPRSSGRPRAHFDWAE